MDRRGLKTAVTEVWMSFRLNRPGSDEYSDLFRETVRGVVDEHALSSDVRAPFIALARKLLEIEGGRRQLI